jgi:hypothetical protein
LPALRFATETIVLPTPIPDKKSSTILPDARWHGHDPARQNYNLNEKPRSIRKAGTVVIAISFASLCVFRGEPLNRKMAQALR